MASRQYSCIVLLTPYLLHAIYPAAPPRYSPEQLYEVVSNVQHYSRFVPWCVGSTVLTRQHDGRYLEAELQIGFQMISER